MSDSTKPSRSKSSLPKLIETYYSALKELANQNVMYEMGTRPAFHRLLQDEGKRYHWTLIAEHEKKVKGKTIRPDGTFKDPMNLVRGYWEAKDTADRLDVEIEKKRRAGYPFNNIIFEDTATAVLFQDGREIVRVDMKDSAKLADLITQFFRHIEPEIEEFEHAVDEFKEKVPDLAEGLAKKIAKAHKENTEFKHAFAAFFELCRTSLNPNLSQAAVDEMLIQHILTERLIREIFDNPEFVRRNVIAAEVEKVMLAMTSQSFDRNTYLKDLDRFYVAIERAARTMTDWSDKQYFLNTVYERFFQGYSVKLADTMGIVYTPQEIVDFMCASVAEVLEKEFGKKLWSDDVYIIDPCTGTGNFIVNVIKKHIPKSKLEDVYKNRLFANEIMLLPYYIAALNIEHTFSEQMERYEAFEGLCFVDTLDMAEHAQGDLSFMTAKNTERVERQKQAPITVVIGNPPYNATQADENDNNKNRKYPVIDKRIRDTYVADSRATLRSKSYDPYWRFIRWATDRLESRTGIVCFVTNNGFTSGKAADGFRKHLRQDFTSIYHFDLRGNARTTGKRRRAEGGNVFQDKIRAGVGVSVLVRHPSAPQRPIAYHAVGDAWRAEAKIDHLKSFPSVSAVPWIELVPDTKNNWLAMEDSGEFAALVELASKEAKGSKTQNSTAIFKTYSMGVSTNRDPVVYDFNPAQLATRVEEFCENYNAELDRYRRKGINPDAIDSFVDYTKVKWSRNLKRHLANHRSIAFNAKAPRLCRVRPFTVQWLYFAPLAVDELGQNRRFFPTATSENQVICCTNHPQIDFIVQMTGIVADAAVGGRGGQCFPFYVYDEDGTNRRENITDWALNQFRDHYKDKKIDKWAIFHYVYGLLHHGGYREKFADNLKRELPRIPFAPEFHAFAEAGKRLAGLHLDYEKLEPWELEFQETPDEPLSYRVEDKMRLSKDKTRLVVNKSLALAGIPSETFEYRLGNRSALEWVVDQYQVSTDKRSGITSDPNRPDDEQYIVRLVGQVVRVSVETVTIVKGLPTEFA